METSTTPIYPSKFFLMQRIIPVFPTNIYELKKRYIDKTGSLYYRYSWIRHSALQTFKKS